MIGSLALTACRAAPIPDRQRYPAGTPLVLHEKQARRFAKVGGSSEVRDRDVQLARLARRIAFQRAARPAGTIAWSFDGAAGEATHAVLTGLSQSTPVTLAMAAPAQVAIGENLADMGLTARYFLGRLKVLEKTIVPR